MKHEQKYVQSGYREGITAGKESAVQSGFDSGFAQTGVPLGREIGLLRGTASALSALLASTPDAASIAEIRDIQSQLSDVRFSDIVPRDLEAEQHAKEHLAAEDGEEDIIEDEELVEKRKMERLEDMMASVGTEASLRPNRIGPEGVGSLKTRLVILANKLGIDPFLG